MPATPTTPTRTGSTFSAPSRTAGHREARRVGGEDRCPRELGRGLGETKRFGQAQRRGHGLLHDHAGERRAEAVMRAGAEGHEPVHILGVAGRTCKPRADYDFTLAPITRVGGYYAREIVFGMAGVGPEEMDLTASYDAFTFTTMLQLEEWILPEG